MDASVFISYATPDEHSAWVIHEHLGTEGLRAWLAPRDLLIGDFPTVIGSAIEACSVLLLVLSEHAVASPWVRRELTMAAHKGKWILPVSIDATDPSADPGFGFILSGLQRVDASIGALDAHLDLITQAVRDLLGDAVLKPEGALPRRTLHLRSHLSRVQPKPGEALASTSWGAIAGRDTLFIVQPDRNDVVVMAVGSPRGRPERWTIRSATRGIVLTSTGSTIAAVTASHVHIAAVTREGRWLAWERTVELPRANAEPLAARSVGREVELLLREGNSRCFCLRISRGRDPETVTQVDGSARAAHATEDGFAVIDGDGKLSPTSDNSPLALVSAREWVNVDQAANGGVAMTAAVVREREGDSLLVARSEGGPHTFRGTTLTARAERVAVARSFDPYAPPSVVAVQTRSQLLVWFWEELVGLEIPL